MLYSYILISELNTSNEIVENGQGTNLSVLLIFCKAAAKDDDGILNFEQFLLQNAEGRIVLSQYQQITTLTANSNTHQTHRHASNVLQTRSDQRSEISNIRQERCCHLASTMNLITANWASLTLRKI